MLSSTLEQTLGAADHAPLRGGEPSQSRSGRRCGHGPALFAPCDGWMAESSDVPPGVVRAVVLLLEARATPALERESRAVAGRPASE